MCLIKDGYDLLSRKVFIGEITDEETMKALPALILMTEDKNKPINIYINSYGGSVHMGLALYDVIKRSKSPVIGHIKGACMSAATLVWLACSERHMDEHSTLMIHEVANDPGYQKVNERKIDYLEMKRLNDLMVKIYKQHTAHDIEFDWYMTKDTYLNKKQVKEWGWL